MSYSLVSAAPTAFPVTLREGLSHLGLPSSASTTTASDASADDTSVTVASATGINVGDALAIGDETATVTDVTGVTLTITPALPNDVPSGAPVTTGDAHELVATLIAAATDTAESLLGRALITRTFTLTLAGFYDPTIPPQGNLRPARVTRIRLPRPPLVSVTTVKYYNASNALTTIADTVYAADTSSEPGVVFLKPSQAWPVDIRLESPQVLIEYLAGYGARADVPAGIRYGVKQLLESLYQSTGTATSERVGNVQIAYSTAPSVAPAALNPYRVFW